MSYSNFLQSLSIGSKVILKENCGARLKARYTKEKIRKILKDGVEAKIQFENSDDLIVFSPEFPVLLPYTKENIFLCDKYRFDKYLEENWTTLKKAKSNEEMTEIYNFIERFK